MIQLSICSFVLSQRKVTSIEAKYFCCQERSDSVDIFTSSPFWVSNCCKHTRRLWWRICYIINDNLIFIILLLNIPSVLFRSIYSLLYPFVTSLSTRSGDRKSLSMFPPPFQFKLCFSLPNPPIRISLSVCK